MNDDIQEKTQEAPSQEKSTAPVKSKLRVGRLIFVIVLILLLFMLVRWVMGNAHRVEEIERKMQDLSLKLDEQNKNAQILNGSLHRFSRDLSEVNSLLYDIKETVQTQGQINSHDMGLIKDDLKNIKSKIDGINIQSGTYRGYYQ